MKRLMALIVLLAVTAPMNAQDIRSRLSEAVSRLMADSQMMHGIAGIYVADARSGEELFSYNGRVGLAPASTQKIVTSVAAFDLLGKDYRFKTEMGYAGTLDEERLTGDLYIRGNGDPTLGSWRFESTRPEAILDRLGDYLRRFRIKKITGNLYVDASSTGLQPLPGGWIWDDIGNYYGAGSRGLNWRENQYDLLLQPGSNEGDPVVITGTSPEVAGFSIVNKLKTGKKRSGDNAYIYYPPYARQGFAEGTFEGGRKISGALPDAAAQFGFELAGYLYKNKIELKGDTRVLTDSTGSKPDVFFAHYSPAMDSIVYWFMKKSINLYGEALVKAFGAEKAGVATTDSGMAVMKRYFRDKGIVSPAEIRIIDGSGLSPSNRLTAEALVKLLVYARQQAWYPSFAASFPAFNGMNLKSGTIRGAKSFAGYHTGGAGREYAVAIIVNNYDGSAGEIVSRMYKVLDVLK